MQLESLPVEKGQLLFFEKQTPSGNTLYKPGTVVDTEETTKAVKLKHGKGGTSWFPLAQLHRSEPKKEEVKA